jgi:hypothetical protein
MDWLEPWSSVEGESAEYLETFRRQLEREVGPEHSLSGLPVRLIARGPSDDVLFWILDGSGRVAEVHLTWAKRQENFPWPITSIYPSLEDWSEQRMRPEHEEWRFDV